MVLIAVIMRKLAQPVIRNTVGLHYVHASGVVASTLDRVRR